MKFGVMCHPHWPAHMTQLEAYDEVLEIVDNTEKLGYDALWCTEHHFGSDPDYVPFGLKGPYPAYDLIVDPLTFLATAAGRTKRIRLGTAVLVTHYDNPIRMAERAAMVDMLSRGRLNLGVGRGGGVWEPKVFGVPSDPDENTDKFFETLDIFLKAWSGKRFKHEGKFFNFPEVSVVPSPMQSKLPVFLSNRNRRSIEYAGRNGLSYIAVTGAWGMAGADGHNEFHDLFLKVSAEHGHSTAGTEFPQTLFTYVAPTDAEAEDMAEKSLQDSGAFGESHYQNRRFGGQTTAPPIGSADANSNTATPPIGPAPSPTARYSASNAQASFGRGAGGADRAEGFKRQLESNLIGSPKTVAEKLRAVSERMPSMNHVICLFQPGAPPAEFTRRSMRMVAEQVMPHFQTKKEAVIA